jgi:hypothetical protein
MCQDLSEDFIREFQDKVHWFCISEYQKLSEDFIKEFKDKVDWNYISIYQNLSEDFIKEFQDKVDWDWTSKYQNLSEDFIREFKDKVDWNYISEYQNLSEDFIREFQDQVNWSHIEEYQNLSEDFRKEFDFKIPEYIWLYKSKEDKLQYIKKNTNYEIIDDKYIIAYKSIRNNWYSVYNFQYKYEIGKTFYSHCDCNIYNENSFGLSSWTKEGALRYYDRGRLLKVKIPIDKIGAIVHNNQKIRSFELTAIEEIEK